MPIPEPRPPEEDGAQAANADANGAPEAHE
jgi:hypothetical protein